MTMALLTVVPRWAAGAPFITVKTMNEISSGMKFFTSLSELYLNFRFFLPSLTTLNGHNFMFC